jgi:hypothetical protein
MRLSHTYRSYLAMTSVRVPSFPSTNYGTTLPPLGAVHRQRGRRCDRGRRLGGILFESKGMAPEEVFGGREPLRVVETYRNFLAEADYARVDFERGIRNDRCHRVA